MRLPFYLNKEELNECMHVFCWSARQYVLPTGRPIVEMWP